MDWLFLLFAGMFEIGWPIGLKLSQTTENKFFWLAVSVLSLSASGVFLWMAQKTIPMGTAYAIWTGIGAVGAFVAGILYFHDSMNFWRILSAFFIVAGIVGLKLSHS
ncbi:MAG: multidrug efflux SMR transporter [Leptospira sp.]|nr:multidrug efflux SMR transporter [Leptospira sp.]